mmetsp:Transcript_5769/g.16515  ORF Transcript_5769/g.16515 Transcript_5769/m.16515 type:complete len:260 (-) Transcript_5769:130-909(-)
MGNQQSRRQQGQAAAPPAGPAAYPPGSGPPQGAYPPVPQPQGYASGQLQPPNQFYPGYRPPPPQQYAQQPPRYMQQAPKPQPPPQQLTKTATIRNSVNLKKATLRLQPLPGNPQQLLISFTFDNSAPCRVSTFVAATEEPTQGCRISSANQPWAPPARFEKGLGLQFPPPGTTQHVIDLSRHAEASLLTAPAPTAAGAVYPLIIRLETVTERGLKEGHTLEVTWSASILDPSPCPHTCMLQNVSSVPCACSYTHLDSGL